MDLLIDTVLKNLIKNKFELKAENDCFCENHHTERIVSALINCFLRIRTDLQWVIDYSVNWYLMLIDHFSDANCCISR